MRSFIVTTALALFAASAHAQTVTDISTVSCNVALTACAIIDVNEVEYDLVGSPVYDGDVTVNGVTCATASVLDYQTNYRIQRELTVACADGTVLSGQHTSTRSGSGRGGWSWHQHVSFDTVSTP